MKNVVDVRATRHARPKEKIDQREKDWTRARKRKSGEALAGFAAGSWISTRTWAIQVFGSFLTTRTASL
jgi:hypothetical protein